MAHVYFSERALLLEHWRTEVNCGTEENRNITLQLTLFSTSEKHISTNSAVHKT